MSLFENDHYRWRETYFVLFDSGKRPTWQRTKHVLSALSAHYTLSNFSHDKKGLLESLTLLAPDDFAALDVCYVGGDEVLEQGSQLAREIKFALYDPADQERLKKLGKYDGRFDVLHFEQIADPGDEEEADADELLDPSAVLIVLDALAKLTDGIAIDPQSGILMQ
jgi:hypothetical protein